MKPNKIVDKAVGILEDKKARDIEVIDISEVSTLADFFVICNGTSITHIKTLADELELKMAEAGYRYYHKEGYNSARWILMDFGEVVVHIFHEEDRSFYNLERLWSDGKSRLAGRGRDMK
ncbi:MAG: ribosome silencing factor [Ruminiclostridium sp.]|nr:ribosome silencing factor [Ruminiclostridium sp.]